jgi:hypothetical protein
MCYCTKGNDTIGGPLKEEGGSGMEMPDTCHILSSQKPNKKIGKEFSTTRGPNLFDSKLTAYAGLIYTYIP